MSQIFNRLLIILFAAAFLGSCDKDEPDVPLPDGYWGRTAVEPILHRTITVRLAPELSHLSPAETKAVGRLLQAGQILHTLYLRSKHPEAETALQALESLHTDLGEPQITSDLKRLYRIFKGPIATTLDNQRAAFLPVVAELPGKNFYPADLDTQQFGEYLASNPDSAKQLLHPRSIVRRASAENLAQDIAVLERYPALATLHPGLAGKLRRLQADMTTDRLYGLPYSLAYADELMQVYELLWEAAGLLDADDPELGGYLKLRARDLISDDYEAGDAAWVTGEFGNLNVQIGSYETYDDNLYGIKTAFSLSLLARDEKLTLDLQAALSDLQSLEDALPYTSQKQVRRRIPVGVYNVIADFGQARSTNTATILPNDAMHTRRYGRTILLRNNIMRNPDIFGIKRAMFNAVVSSEYDDDLTMQGEFQRTLWHEVGHYLGVDRAADGRDLDQALAEYSDMFEEMKSDLVSLFSARQLADAGIISRADMHAIYATGVRRTLQRVKPRRAQPYQTMQLMQMNFYLAYGLIEFDTSASDLQIDYNNYHAIVAQMLREVLDIQLSGDRERAAKFVDDWTRWDEDLHQVLADRVNAANQDRYRIVFYTALGE